MLKTLITGVGVKSFLIMLGAVLACSAPYIHMFFPHKSESILVLEKKYEQGAILKTQYDTQLVQLKAEQSFMGFTNARRFWYAAGMPTTMFFFAILFLIASEAIGDRNIRRAIRFSSLVFFLISVYQLVWVLWPGQDLPKSMYHLAIAVMSVIATIICYLLTRYKLGLKTKIERLIRFISIEAYFKYIKQEDRQEYLQDSFSVYDEISKSR